jgi:predicted nuclease of predicted toxin-antitoxin system
VVRFHLDQHVSRKIAAALRKRGIDVTTTGDAGLQGAHDLAHLAFALAENRVIVTQDADFLRRDAEGVPHAGIAFCRQGTRTIGQMISHLALMHELYSDDDVRGRVEFL